MTTHDDDGFTLLELLIAIMIAAVVFAVGAVTFSLALASTDDSQQRLTESQAVDFSNNYFAKDAQSANTTSFSSNCGSGSGQVAVALAWVEGASSTAKNVTYRVGSDPGTLVRYACDGSTVSSQRLIASELAGAPSVACTPSCTAPTRLVMTLTTKSGATFTFEGSPRKTRP